MAVISRPTGPAMPDSALRGLYAIADTGVIAPDVFGAAIAAALAGGARLVQYRDKGNDRERRAAQAATLVSLCREAGAIAIVNDDVELALTSGAHGVHVGRDDNDPVAVRQHIGPDRLLGVSCYDDPGRAREAAAMGADYVAFGSVFPSATKPDAVHAPLGLLRLGRSELPVPICAIGGITADNAGEVFAAGAHMVAVIRDLFDRDDIRARAARIAGTER